MQYQVAGPPSHETPYLECFQACPLQHPTPEAPSTGEADGNLQGSVARLMSNAGMPVRESNSLAAPLQKGEVTRS